LVLKAARMSKSLDRRIISIARIRKYNRNKIADKLMNTDITDIGDIKSSSQNIDNGMVTLQTGVLRETKDFLRLESVRRRVSMGILIDEMVKFFFNVPESTS
jgi:hypothetical protein